MTTPPDPWPAVAERLEARAKRDEDYAANVPPDPVEGAALRRLRKDDAAGLRTALTRITDQAAEIDALRARAEAAETIARERGVTVLTLTEWAGLHLCRAEAAERSLSEHTEAVSKFISEMYCTMIDPCAEGPINIQKCCAELLEAAVVQRERLNNAEAAERRVGVLSELLREGVEEAWCDAVLGIAPHLIENGRAVRFRDHFYDWQKRVRAALASGSADRGGEG